MKRRNNRETRNDNFDAGNDIEATPKKRVPPHYLRRESERRGRQNPNEQCRRKVRSSRYVAFLEYDFLVYEFFGIRFLDIGGGIGSTSPYRSCWALSSPGALAGLRTHQGGVLHPTESPKE